MKKTVEDPKRQTKSDGRIHEWMLDERYKGANEPQFFKLRITYDKNNFQFFGGTYNAGGTPVFTDKGKTYDWKSMAKVLFKLQNMSEHMDSYFSSKYIKENFQYVLDHVDVVTYQVSVAEVADFKTSLSKFRGY